MRQVTSRRAKSLLLPIAAIATSLLLSGQLLGARGFVLAAVISFLWLAWRFDNHTGSIFLLAVLLLIIFGVIVLLIAFMAVTFGGAA